MSQALNGGEGGGRLQPRGGGGCGGGGQPFQCKTPKSIIELMTLKCGKT